MHVSAIPAFADNYLWLIHDEQHAVVVDPGDAAPVLAMLASKNLTLNAILLTHHHADHAGGVAALLEKFPVPVYGPANEKIAGVTDKVDEQVKVTLPELNLELSVIDVPGHTAGHIAYFAAEQQWLFCGDTLFAGGCGRLFEGTALQMTISLAKLAALPDSTLVYCAHEYTLSNLRFACAAEPDNSQLQARLIVEQDKRAHGMATVPSTIGMEKATNPFLRYKQPTIAQQLRLEGRLKDRQSPAEITADVTVFAALREWKNNFR